MDFPPFLTLKKALPLKSLYSYWGKGLKWCGSKKRFWDFQFFRQILLFHSFKKVVFWSVFLVFSTHTSPSILSLKAENWYVDLVEVPDGPLAGFVYFLQQGKTIAVVFFSISWFGNSRISFILRKSCSNCSVFFSSVNFFEGLM